MGQEIIAVVGGQVVPVVGETIEGGMVILEGGTIRAVGRDLDVPPGATVIDAAGRWVLPGFVEPHAHVGLTEEADGWAGHDNNELSDPVTPHVRAIDAVNPADLAFRDAVTGGVLAVNVTPGSGNVIGGQTAAIKTWGRIVDEMVMRAPAGMKSALGENPKSVYADRKTAPFTRLGTAAVIREALVETANYMAAAVPGRRNLRLEALARVLRREIPWRQHCHRADDIATAIRIAEEFGYDLIIDHGTEAHLIADVVAAKGIPVIIGPLLSNRSKVETRQRSIANPGRLAAAGVTISITTDHPNVPIQYLVHQATLAVKEGLDRDIALEAITINPARLLGVADRIGSLEPGKDGDLVLWSGDPLDVASRAERALIGGREIYRYDADSHTPVFRSR